MGIIKFTKKKEKTAEDVVNDLSVHIDNFTHDVAELINNEGYGDILENNLSGVIVILDFNSCEVSAEICIDEELLKEINNREKDDSKDK